MTNSSFSVPLDGLDWTHVSPFISGNLAQPKLFGEFNIPTGRARILKVIYKNPLVIIVWSDHTKTIAKCRAGDSYNQELGFTLCLLRKLITNKKLRETMEDWLPEGQINLFGEYTVTLSEVRKKHK